MKTGDLVYVGTGVRLWRIARIIRRHPDGDPARFPWVELDAADNKGVRQHYTTHLDRLVRADR